MASQTAICNRALEHLGADPIVNITDDTKEAKALKRVWEDSLKAFLVEHPWHFAKKRAALPASATKPAWGFASGYPVPADFLRLLQIKGYRDFSLEADPTGTDWILSNAPSPLMILYLYNLTDTNRLPPHAVEALSRRLALDIVEDITQSNTKKQAAEEEYLNALAIAKRVNGLQKSPDALPAGSWLIARRSAGDRDWYNVVPA
jgi:hypothetical protein